ncbi:MAG TPA: hypothetical protein VEP89_09595 [Draconibacterium sp.]|nr:hypothetical protein [Draconibacterium sp.]
MKKILLSGIIVLIYSSSFSQSFDIGFGYSSSEIVSFDMGYIAKNNFAYYIEIGTQVPRGTSGEDYTGTINWDEYREDHRSYGEYYNIYNLAVGYKIGNSVLLAGVLGYADKYSFVNSYDNLHILGDNGAYFIRGKLNDDAVNAGIKAKYFISLRGGGFISMGINASTIQGVGLNIGIAL